MRDEQIPDFEKSVPKPKWGFTYSNGGFMNLSIKLLGNRYIFESGNEVKNKYVRYGVETCSVRISPVLTF